MAADPMTGAIRFTGRASLVQGLSAFPFGGGELERLASGSGCFCDLAFVGGNAGWLARGVKLLHAAGVDAADMTRALVGPEAIDLLSAEDAAAMVPCFDAEAAEVLLRLAVIRGRRNRQEAWRAVLGACLGQGVDPDCRPRGFDDGTALFHAVLVDDEWMVAELLAAGADPDAPCAGGVPLRMAKEPVVAGLLRQAGAAPLCFIDEDDDITLIED